MSTAAAVPRTSRRVPPARVVALLAGPPLLLALGSVAGHLLRGGPPHDRPGLP